jgi:uncharacterized protein DUF2637
MKLKPDLTEGGGVAYAGLVIGVTLSVAGNVAHAFVPPDDAVARWTPPLGLIISSLSWPIILFFTLEIMLSIRWPAGRAYWYLYVVRWGVLSGVAGVAAVVSYQHMSGLLRHWHESDFAWRYGPLAVDGLLIMSSAALVVLRLTSGASGAPTPTPVPAPVKTPVAPTPKPKPVLKTASETPKPSGAPDASPSDAERQPAGNARLVLDALPGTLTTLVEKTGVKRTTVDYTLKKALAGQVRQDDDRIWHRVNGSTS